MKLENALFELTTLVDYGTYYLAKKTALLDELKPSDVANRMDVPDLIRYLIRDDWGRYMLDEIGSYDIVSYVKDNLDVTEVFDSDELLDLVGSYDIKQYVKDNYDADDVFDSDDMLDCLSEETIKNYVSSTYELEDWVNWR